MSSDDDKTLISCCWTRLLGAPRRHINLAKGEATKAPGHISPEGFWYDQDENEWVVVLKGRAKVLFESDDEPIEMEPGDYINIPAHKRHRVEWTALEEPTIWLAVFYR